MGLTIDRATFLGLTVGLSAGACNTGPGPAVAANVIDIPRQPETPDAGATPARPPEPEKPVAAVSDDDDDDVGDPTDEGGVVMADATCGFVDPKTVSRPGGSCDDAQGTAPSCASITWCPGFTFPREQCESYRKNLKPKAAQRAIDCIAKLSQRQRCDDACNIYRCGDRALKASCPDPSADAMCRVIVSKCPSTKLAECQTYLSSLNATGRTKVLSCMIGRNGCGFGLFSCTEGL